MPALIVTQNGCLFAIPQNSLVELLCLYDKDVRTKIEHADNLEIFRLRGGLLPLVRLNEVLARPTRFSRNTGAEIVKKYQHPDGIQPEPLDQTGPENATPFGQSLNFVVLKSDSSHYGLIVDGIVGTEEIVVKPMHRALKSLGIYAGATIMGNGKVALILDVEGIARHADPMLELTAKAEGEETGLNHREMQQVLLFKSGPKEQFAVPVALIRRIEKVDMHEVERIGDREYITIDDISTRVLRLDHALKVSSVEEHENMHLILPRHFNRPVGILISKLIDIEETFVEIDTESYPEDGLLGTAIIRSAMTLFIDIYRLVEIIEPEWFADRRGKMLRGQGSMSGSAKKVLLLEDNSFFRHLIKGYLESDGYTVVTAENGRIGLERMAESAFDLIVSDLDMPEMNGWEFLKEVRQAKRSQAIPAMALTALNSPDDRKHASESGFDRYVVKIDRERFLTATAELLGMMNK